MASCKLTKWIQILTPACGSVDYLPYTNAGEAAFCHGDTVGTSLLLEFFFGTVTKLNPLLPYFPVWVTVCGEYFALNHSFS
jgi:hypothetical protein